MSLAQVDTNGTISQPSVSNIWYYTIQYYICRPPTDTVMKTGGQYIARNYAHHKVQFSESKICHSPEPRAGCGGHY